MKFDKLSFRAAVERLRSQLGLGTTPALTTPLVTGKFKAAPLTLAADADGQAAMRQVLDYYHKIRGSAVRARRRHPDADGPPWLGSRPLDFGFDRSAMP